MIDGKKKIFTDGELIMETEILKIFDKHQNYIGTAPRAEVHRLGY